MLTALFESLRPRQWTKNLVLFAALLFAERLTDPASVVRIVIAFFLFCLLSGSVYLLNDLKDVESDRLHPTKRDRPIASHRLPENIARGACIAAIATGLIGSFLLSPELMTRAVIVHAEGAAPVTMLEPSFFSFAVAYLVLQFAYTLLLKHVVILDVMAIAFGFVIRAAAGAAVIAVEISDWLLICTIFLSLFLALAKRRAEIVLLADGASHHRKTLAEYDADLLDQMIAIAASACLISYALYTASAETVAKFGTSRLTLTIPFVIFGLFRYLYLIDRHEDGGDPSSSLISDRPLLYAVLLWGATAAAVLYS